MRSLGRGGERARRIAFLSYLLILVNCDEIYLQTDEAPILLHGVESGAGFGQVLGTGVGLFTGSSKDLFVAAPAARGAGGEARTGAVYLFSDPTPGVRTASAATLRLSGAVAQGYFGASLATCDVNGDGWPDLLVGAPSAGRVYGFFGPLSQSLSSASQASFVLTGTEGAGASLTCLGDIDGDGPQDFAAGDPETGQQAGAVYVVSGGSALRGTLSLSSVGRAIRGAQSQGRFGHALAAVGDVNRDGTGELLVGAPGYSLTFESQEGAAYLFSLNALPYAEGAGAGTRFVGAESPDHAGSAVASAGDVNGDGIPDFLIGAPDSEEGGEDAGTAYLIFGRALFEESIPLTWASARIVGELGGDFAGTALAGADIDGDGYSDPLVGAPSHSTSREDIGAAYLVRGPVFERFELEGATVHYEGSTPGEHAGTALLATLSFLGDPRIDVVVGAPGGSYGGAESVGLVAIYPAGGLE